MVHVLHNHSDVTHRAAIKGVTCPYIDEVYAIIGRIWSVRDITCDVVVVGLTMGAGSVRMCVPLSGGVPSSTSERAAEMFRDVKVVWSSRTYITAGENCGGWLRNSTQM